MKLESTTLPAQTLLPSESPVRRNQSVWKTRAAAPDRKNSPHTIVALTRGSYVS